ncbi:MAG: hypothetical protein JWM33_3751, partial [Caulobacteraceae bacterium]|nr:hypothetical protein [Caulobacteraceae bacterium]
VIAFMLGRLSERVQALEQDGQGHGSLALAFAEFKGEVRGILQGQTEKMEGLRADLTWLRQAAVYERPGGGA